MKTVNQNLNNGGGLIVIQMITSTYSMCSQIHLLTRCLYCFLLLHLMSPGSNQVKYCHSSCHINESSIVCGITKVDTLLSQVNNVNFKQFLLLVFCYRSLSPLAFCYMLCITILYHMISVFTTCLQFVQHLVHLLTTSK